MSSPAEALKAVVGAAMAGVSVLSLCEKGDAFIMAETGKIFKKEKDMKKGKSAVAFRQSPSVSLTQHSLVHSFIHSLTHSLSLSLSLAGIAFPTCVSVNNCVCHYSPLKSDPDLIVKDGDLVKM